MIRLLYSGQFRDPSGYGKAALMYLKALDDFRGKHQDKIDFRINCIQYEGSSVLSPADAALVAQYELDDYDKREAWIADGPFLFVGHHLINSLVSEPSNQPYLHRADRVICMTVWETSRLPKLWTEIAKAGDIDSLIVPCEWNGFVFEECTGLPVYTLPHVVPYAPEVPRVPIVPGCCNFLAVSQWIYRKGWDVLIKAYLMEFHGNPDACLIVKSYRSNTSAEERQYIKDNIAEMREQVFVAPGVHSDARILFIGDLLPDADMERLYAGADVFVLLSRGEGFGLPYSEAISRGLPVICPVKGGHVDFVDLENAYTVSGGWEPCHTQGLFYTSDMQWYEPSTAETREALRQAFDDWKADKLKARGEKCREFLERRHLDYASIGVRFFNILESEAKK